MLNGSLIAVRMADAISVIVAAGRRRRCNHRRRRSIEAYAKVEPIAGAKARVMIVTALKCLVPPEITGSAIIAISGQSQTRGRNSHCGRHCQRRDSKSLEHFPPPPGSSHIWSYTCSSVGCWEALRAQQGRRVGERLCCGCAPSSSLSTLERKMCQSCCRPYGNTFSPLHYPIGESGEPIA